MSEENGITTIQKTDRVSVDTLNENFKNLEGRLKKLEEKCGKCTCETCQLQQ